MSRSIPEKPANAGENANIVDVVRQFVASRQADPRLQAAIDEGRDISNILDSFDLSQNLLGAAELDRMKQGAVFINTARAELVDEAALIARLRSGHIAAAGIDVYWKEPLPRDHPLLALDNVVTTPHVGFNTPEATVAMVDMGIDNLVQYFGGDPINVVAAPERNS